MTRLLSRILLAIIMFPLAAVVYICVFVLLEQELADEFALLWTSIVVAFFVALYWLALWRQSVRWTPYRVMVTMVSGPGCVAAGGGGVGAIIIAALPYNDEELGIFLGGIAAISLWLAVTVLLWRETPAERAERVRQAAGVVLFCPRCGYNMTGLYEGRCPECGTKYTLDQLYAAQQREGIGDVAEAGEEATE
jgi:hypothetical protein